MQISCISIVLWFRLLDYINRFAPRRSRTLEMSAVYNAVVSLDHELLLSVLEQGHFVDEPWEEWTPLYALANNVKWHENIPKILQTLLEYGADTNIACEQRLSYRCSTKFYSTPLLEVVCRDYKENDECRVEMILLLIK
jgi:hypothetical protein